VKATYRVLAGLVSVLVAVQAAAIASGTFGVLHSVDDGTPFTESTDANAGQIVHSAGAMAIALVAVLLLVVSFFARIEDGVKWAGFVFLSVVVQWVAAILAFGAPVVGIVHGVNALVLFGLGMAAASAAKRSMRPTTGSPAGRSVSV